ncbi:MAG TPA: PDZ domain-containing protein [Gemmatimonadales bacterium]|nr:PDZ domain-containing protein [Gemmatimonadales bacterium]
MTRHWTSASLALLTLAAAPLAAQDRDAERERTRTEDRQNAEERAQAEARARGLILERRPYRERELTAFGFGRARIGVSVAVDDEDRDGARIESVLDDGPADKAGLRAGDIITRFGDTRLDGDDAGERLVELARALDPGDTVRVEYTRDGRRANATIVAREIENTFTMAIPSMERLAPMMHDLRERVMVLGGSAIGGMQLKEMTPELGEYFGTDEGVLVLDAPSDSTLPLRAGDVILAIDGREVQSASHAQRILASYAEDETVSFNIMRKQQRQTLEWKVPENRWKVQGNGRNGVYQFRRPARVAPQGSGRTGA